MRPVPSGWCAGKGFPSTEDATDAIRPRRLAVAAASGGTRATTPRGDARLAPKSGSLTKNPRTFCRSLPPSLIPSSGLQKL